MQHPAAGESPPSLWLGLVLRCGRGWGADPRCRRVGDAVCAAAAAVAPADGGAAAAAVGRALCAAYGRFLSDNAASRRRATSVGQGKAARKAAAASVAGVATLLPPHWGSEAAAGVGSARVKGGGRERE